MRRYRGRGREGGRKGGREGGREGSENVESKRVGEWGGRERRRMERGRGESSRGR